MKLREPTEVQRAALGAALCPQDLAIDAFQRLRELTNDLDRTDDATFRLLPMVYRNLKDGGVDDAELLRLKGIYRQSWYRNRLSVNAGMQAIRTLREVGVEPIALKGLGMIASAYPEAALRPMLDVDLLVAPAQFHAAASALLKSGWAPSRGSTGDFFRRAKVFHAMPLVGPDKVEIDLHRAILEEGIHSGVDTLARSRVVQAMIGSETLTTLSPEDHLIHVCVHGSRWDWVPVVRWIGDVAFILRSSPEVDWGYITEQSRSRRVSLAVGAALELASSYIPEIPKDVAPTLLGFHHGPLEAIDFRAQNSPDTALFMASRALTRYARMASRRGVARQLSDLPTYFEWIWELDSPSQVPVEGARRVWRKLRAP